MMVSSQEAMRTAAKASREMGKAVEEGLKTIEFRLSLDEGTFLTSWPKERLIKLGEQGQMIGISVDLDSEELVYRLFPPSSDITEIYQFFATIVQGAVEGKEQILLGATGIPEGLFDLYPDLEERFQVPLDGRLQLVEEEVDLLHLYAWGLYRRYGKQLGLEPFPRNFF